ncbi:hypothetical protein PF005_g14484 [Phytophthora fragariae]|uniref:Uncharacterized protein n=1 Tax=Phytophthora fragariae TaxID=53985 RepID=A0A6A3U4P0_9STRA|nr:hypothetical protein PF003_g715 [Phytophthora fragariae]KAE8933120.1 hypothetical protein PF009_g16862 [Phytophthora fragariae]KAE9002078.1 hypothetical protein PF011_g13463 [Phytophthora fragariae]KAE9102181.1 hypothetical protein PF007_g14850 [Phytophthora fragariae]KAE9146136.1 hypothetical protein PF006_g9071 [Phytophthora fragariae]
MSKDLEVTEATSHNMQVAYREPASVRLNVDGARLKERKESESHDILLGPDDKPLKKFLWWYMTKKQRILVIVGLVVLLLVVLFLIGWFAIIPAIIRHYASSVQMTLNYMDVVSILENSTLTVDLSLDIQHDVGIAATTDNTTVSLLFDGAVFATLPFSGLDIKTGSQDYNITIDTDMPITDQSVFNTMSNALMNEAEIALMATASLNVRALGMSFSDLSFERELPLEGFTGFSDPKPVIENIELTTCTSSEYMININVTLDNTARMGQDGIGALNMSLYYGQQYIGYALSLKPELGIPRGVSDQSYLITVDANVVSISSMMLSALAGSTQFYLVGNNPYVTTHGQFVEALNNVNMSVPSSSGSLTNMNIGSSCSLVSLLS